MIYSRKDQKQVNNGRNKKQQRQTTETCRSEGQNSRLEEKTRRKEALDGYVGSSASWRLKKLSEEWECSLAGVIERLVLEADEKYSDILFPETKEPDGAPLSQTGQKSWAGKICWNGK